MSGVKNHKSILRVWQKERHTRETMLITVEELTRLRAIEEAYRILVGAAERALPASERQERLHRGLTAVGPIVWE